MSLTFILFIAVVFASVLGSVVVWIIDKCGSEK